MFKRDHHVRIATILQALDAEELLSKGCLFGGGTAIVLSFGEYRESVDIDLMISDLSFYRDMRLKIKEANSLSPIVRKNLSLNLSREIRADQYGIRTMIDQGGSEIKFEIVFEGRVKFQPPGPDDNICGISTLSKLDMATSKLLANSDRWADDSVFSRDLIDLAMLNLPTGTFRQALEKAALAYGGAVETDLIKAIESLKNRKGRLNHCMSTLKMDSTPEALLWEKIRSLRKKCARS
ncbi:MAG: nucleotidyl transferase AbiEii/AbiGii toxin family protein [Bdellovibrionales bacterium]|nr:nucleotidyl transferase AbiEii/AbiGii toxin family protein [Bdellovibrionales bacterium]